MKFFRILSMLLVGLCWGQSQVWAGSLSADPPIVTVTLNSYGDGRIRDLIPLTSFDDAAITAVNSFWSGAGNTALSGLVNLQFDKVLAAAEDTILYTSENDTGLSWGFATSNTYGTHAASLTNEFKFNKWAVVGGFAVGAQTNQTKNDPVLPSSQNYQAATTTVALNLVFRPEVLSGFDESFKEDSWKDYEFNLKFTNLKYSYSVIGIDIDNTSFLYGVGFKYTFYRTRKQVYFDSFNFKGLTFGTGFFLQRTESVFTMIPDPVLVEDLTYEAGSDIYNALEGFCGGVTLCETTVAAGVNSSPTRVVGSTLIEAGSVDVVVDAETKTIPFDVNALFEIGSKGMFFLSIGLGVDLNQGKAVATVDAKNVIASGAFTFVGNGQSWFDFNVAPTDVQAELNAVEQSPDFHQERVNMAFGFQWRRIIAEVPLKYYIDGSIAGGFHIGFTF